MEYKIFELKDNRFLGICAFEITSFPSINTLGRKPEEHIAKVANEFKQVLLELHKLSDENTCIEQIWLSERVQNQTFLSNVRIFIVLRKIGSFREQVVNGLQAIRTSFITSLSAMQYSTQIVQLSEDNLLDEMLSKIDTSCVYGIVKRESCISNVNSPYPYYLVDILPNNSINNFSSIVSMLSQNENCCISFQLFPVVFSADESTVISELNAELGRISSGFMLDRQMYRDATAAEPMKVLSYYNERRFSPLFMYNILAFGNKSSCASIAARLFSLLQSGEAKVGTSDLLCIDLSEQQISFRNQFPQYVWNINNQLVFHYRNLALFQSVPLATRLMRLPYLLSVEEANVFFRLPLYEKSMVAIKANQITYAQEQFGAGVVSEDNIQIGTLKGSDSNQITIGCSEKSFTKHALIVGTPGSGKTTFSVNLLLQFARRGIPFLAIEPTKTEYRAMIDAIDNLRVFTPGNNSVSPYIINPFIPPKGIRVEQYIPSLASAFKAAFSMPSPLDMIFLKAIKSCYIKYGWKDYSKVGDPDVTLFGLHEFIITFKHLLDHTNYSKEVRGNLESAGLLRLTNLIEQNSNIYDTINTVPIEDLLTAPTVLELNAIDNAEQKALIMALLLISICIYTKHNQIGDGELKNVILIDEAHVLLGGGSASRGNGDTPDSQATTVKALQDMIAEIRSYGTSIIIADQSPTKVSREVVANTDIKVAFRLVQSIEKELIADSTNMDEDGKNNLSRLKPGEAYVYYSKLDTPQMVITEDIREKEGIRLSVPNEEVASRTTYWKEHQELLKPFSECSNCEYCKETCDFHVRSDAEYLANKAMNRYRKSLISVDNVKKCVFGFPKLMKSDLESRSYDNPKKVVICARIQLLRKIEMDTDITLSDAEAKSVLSKFPTV